MNKLMDDSCTDFVDLVANAGVTMQEAAKAASDLAKVAFENWDIEVEISRIKVNPSLNWWQKRRLIKQLKKAKGTKKKDEQAN